MRLPATRAALAAAAVAALLSTLPAAPAPATGPPADAAPSRDLTAGRTTVTPAPQTVPVAATADERPGAQAPATEQAPRTGGGATDAHDESAMSDTVGARALRNALSKVGAPYRWGAAGPSAFDCSGLVQWAYREAGVHLPRTSQAMSKVGTPVTRSDLRPGDLVFFYRPVSHVGIYAGDGKIVHASTEASPVKISPIARMPFNSARRIQG